MNKFRPEQYIYGVKNTTYTVKQLIEAIDSGEILEAEVVSCDADLTLHFNLGHNITGSIVVDEFEYSLYGKPTKNIAIVSRTGKRTQFMVIGYTENSDGSYHFELSRKAAQKDCYDNFIADLQVGQVINAYATHIENYGIFCDIGAGITALLPIENVCTTRIRNPKVELKGVRRLKVIVKGYNENNQMILSHKELLGTWSEEAAKFEQGSTVTGNVSIIEDYGIFIQLAPNLVGLADPFEGVKTGDLVSVFIKSIVPEKMKIKLSIVNVVNDRPDRPRPMHYKYYLPEDGMVKHWRYSPEGASKILETSFE